MRFKTDENIPLEAVDLLRVGGHDALSVFDQSLAGRPDGTANSGSSNAAGSESAAKTDVGSHTGTET